METLEAIKVTFFQECEELLGDLETGLLSLQAGEGDDETVNAVFRAVHSVKGGAGAFGLEALVRFAHTFETTLDKVRSGALKADEAVLKVMLRATDILADLVQAAKTDAVVDPDRIAESSEDLEAFWGGHDTAAPAAAAGESDDWDFTPLAFAPVPSLAPAGPPRWTVWFKPSTATYAKGNDTVLLLRELATTGTISLANFWARRARRLLPASGLVLVVTLVAGRVVLDGLSQGDLARDAVAASLFVANIRFWADGHRPPDQVSGNGNVAGYCVPLGSS